MQSADATFRNHDDPISRRHLLQATAAVAGLLAAQPNASRAAVAPTDEALADAAPGHVETVRTTLFDQLDGAQLSQLQAISETLLGHLTATGSVPPVPGVPVRH